MKGENQFNAFLSRELKKHLPRVFSVKLADKYKTGLSDFVLWMDGTSVALECKSIGSLPSSAKAKVLDHPFSATQLNFFRRFIETGCLAYGLVSISDSGMTLFPAQFLISMNGNLHREDFITKGLLLPRNTRGVSAMLDYFRGNYGGQ